MTTSNWKIIYIDDKFCFHSNATHSHCIHPVLSAFQIVTAWDVRGRVLQRKQILR